MKIFRFYNKAIKKVLGGGYPYYLKPDGRIVSIYAKIEKNEADFDEENIDSLGVHVCSGIMDSNNKMIFESDIIEYKSQKYEVLFVKGCFLIKTEENKTLLLTKIPTKEMLIVGNAVENPIKVVTAKKKAPLPDLSSVKLRNKDK